MFGFQRKSTNGKIDTLSVGFGGSYINASTDITPASLINANKSFVYACVSKISQYVSSVPIHTYYYSNNPDSLVASNSMAPTRVKAYMPHTAKIRHKALEMVEIDDPDHPLVSLIMAPAEGYSYPDWISVITAYLLMMGNCLLEIKKKSGKITGLQPLQWEWTYPQINNGTIEYYNYSPPNEQARILQPKDVIHIIQRGPGNLVVGRGNLSAAIDSVSLYNFYDAYQISLAKNYAMPGVNVSVKNKVSNVEEAKKLADDFIRKFGRANTGRPIVTFGDVEVLPIGMPPKDMAYREGRQWAMKVICSCFGVPEDLISTDDSNRASSVTAIAQFIRVTCYPLLSKVLEQINTQVVEQFYDPNAYFWYDPQEILVTDQVQQSSVLTSYVNRGIMTINEAREVLELEL